MNIVLENLIASLGFTFGQRLAMSDADKEAIEYAHRRGFKFPRYRCHSIDVNNQPFTYESNFSPLQFAAITAQPFPECATVENCMHLLRTWTSEKSSFELVLIP